MDQFYAEVKSYKNFLANKYQGKPLNRTGPPDMTMAILPEKTRLNIEKQAITEYLKETKNLPDEIKKEITHDKELTEKALERINDRERQQSEPQGPPKWINPPDKNPNINTAIAIYDHPNGWMIGRENWSPEKDEWIITNDLSGPFARSAEAEKEYDKIQEFRNILPGIGKENLEKCANAFEDRIDEDPANGLKAALIRDHLQHEREEPKKEIGIEETVVIEFHER